MLNVDVVTMFNPEMMDMLNQTVEQCENCIKGMESFISKWQLTITTGQKNYYRLSTMTTNQPV